MYYGFFVCFCYSKEGIQSHKRVNKLQKEGILTTAYVDIAFGGGRMGSSFVYYYFYDLNNRLVGKKNKWAEKYRGNKVQGKLLKDIKKGDKIQIKYLKDEPSICQIVGNRGTYYNSNNIFRFFTIMWLIIFAIMFSQIVKIVEVVSLYKYGIATKGIMLLKKIKMTGVDISYQFTDNRGKVHVSKEKFRRVEIANDLVEGATVTVFYKKDNPAKSAIFIYRDRK